MFKAHYRGFRYVHEVLKMLPEIPEPIPVVSLSENNNRSETLEPLSNQPLSLSFLIETKIYSQKLKSKAPKGFQGLAFPSLT
ncbi:hypothetical protein HCG51_11080 [Tolypothrix sp. PCC 7910]|uniref:hypothetical protein n=1 Tax=Tolypothrix sp. PCC 7910 TaxID=2099387 RepID=UPI001427990A|nr:hypothetical protein [Tolypothrix sp. PCC 7910]QIR35276.1 hypothetical protein HCG51_11080 [Tolypothrix sp. PCC 7910]